MKPKATTLQQRMGFVDSELSTPKHDELIFWLMENKQSVAENIFPPYNRNEDQGEDRKQVKGWGPGLSDEAVDRFILTRPTPKIKKIRLSLEVPVNDGRFTIGFMDAEMSISSARFCLEKVGTQAGWKEYEHTDDSKVCIEVKPEIRSFGETLRQMNHYRNHLLGYNFAILCPDNRLKPHFLDQGVILFSPSDIAVDL